jgi:hypothetical protein
MLRLSGGSHYTGPIGARSDRRASPTQLPEIAETPRTGEEESCASAQGNQGKEENAATGQARGKGAGRSEVGVFSAGQLALL